MKIFNLIIMIEEKLFSLGVKLPSAPKAIGSYVPAIVIGNLVFVSGQIPI
jgi:enamine deaminase RidA (YjgF/YER057c/UK114 family)